MRRGPFSDVTEAVVCLPVGRPGEQSGRGQAPGSRQGSACAIVACSILVSRHECDFAGRGVDHQTPNDPIAPVSYGEAVNEVAVLVDIELVVTDFKPLERRTCAAREGEEHVDSIQRHVAVVGLACYPDLHPPNDAQVEDGAIRASEDVGELSVDWNDLFVSVSIRRHLTEARSSTRERRMETET